MKIDWKKVTEFVAYEDRIEVNPEAFVDVEEGIGVGQFRAVMPVVPKFTMPSARIPPPPGGWGFQPAGPKILPTVVVDEKIVQQIKTLLYQWQVSQGGEILAIAPTTEWDSGAEYVARKFATWWNNSWAGKPVPGGGGSAVFLGLPMCGGQPLTSPCQLSKALLVILQQWKQYFIV